MDETLDQLPETPLDDGTLEGEVDIDTTDGDEQVDVEPAVQVDTTDDPVAKKLKDLEAGYTKKYQALADEKRAFEAERARLTQSAQPATPENPSADRYSTLSQEDFELADPIAQAAIQETYELRQTVQQLQNMLLGQVMPTVQESVTAKQVAEIQQRYGEIDTGELLEAAQANPGIPLKYIAADLYGDRRVEQARDETAKKLLSNRDAKLRATAPQTSNAQVKPDADTKGWDIAKHFEHAKRTGQRF